MICGAAQVFALPVKGTVKNAADGSPLSGVIVTDGYDFVRTDERGAFAFEASVLAQFISVVTPSGWLAPCEEGFPRYWQVIDPRTKRYDFRLTEWAASAEGYDMMAIADPQPKTYEQFERLQREIMPPLREHIGEADKSRARAAIILGDIVWDSPQLFDAVKAEFGTLGIPVYPVIGNHDHDLNCNTDREATARYSQSFGPTYYAFDMGHTHYVVLDDICYYGAKRYIEEIDDIQCAWLRKYAELLPKGSRLCIAMHAPVWKSWRQGSGMASALKLAEELKDYEVHFLTGHTHVNSNYDVGNGSALEHNVAQICGNLWRDPINYDGTPRGYLLLREEGDRLIWDYRQIDTDDDARMRIWNLGEVKGYKDRVVAKIWEWDSHWTVVWYEDGEYRGSMQRIQIADPDYEKWVEECRAAGEKITNSRRPNPVNFYFTAKPSPAAKSVRVVATDRFGRQYEGCIDVVRD